MPSGTSLAAPLVGADENSLFDHVTFHHLQQLRFGRTIHIGQHAVQHKELVESIQKEVNNDIYKFSSKKSASKKTLIIECMEKWSKNV